MSLSKNITKEINYMEVFVVVVIIICTDLGHATQTHLVKFSFVLIKYMQLRTQVLLECVNKGCSIISTLYFRRADRSWNEGDGICSCQFENGYREIGLPIFKYSKHQFPDVSSSVFMHIYHHNFLENSSSFETSLININYSLKSLYVLVMTWFDQIEGLRWHATP